MKPILFTLGLATALVGAPGFARAQSQSPQPELLATAPAWGEGQHWGTVPPPRPLPYGYTWNEYRGAEIEHPLYAPRHHGHVARSAAPSCLVSQLCCWFDKLFAPKCATESPAPCQGYVATDLPPLPTLAPAPRPAPSPAMEDTFVEPAPIRIPSIPIVEKPAPQEPQPQPQTGPTDPAPLMPPVDLIPTRPLVSDAPPAPAPTQPAPAQIAPAQIAPVEPAPMDPLPAIPKNNVPKPLASQRPPVVELAPDFVVDGEPTKIAPQHVMPPGVTVPKNVIPKKAVPLNAMPGRR
jgi:hypothetical protein